MVSSPPARRQIPAVRVEVGRDPKIVVGAVPDRPRRLGAGDVDVPLVGGVARQPVLLLLGDVVPVDVRVPVAPVCPGDAIARDARAALVRRVRRDPLGHLGLEVVHVDVFVAVAGVLPHDTIAVDLRPLLLPAAARQSVLPLLGDVVPVDVPGAVAVVHPYDSVAPDARAPLQAAGMNRDVVDRVRLHVVELHIGVAGGDVLEGDEIAVDRRPGLGSHAGHERPLQTVGAEERTGRHHERLDRCSGRHRCRCREEQREQQERPRTLPKRPTHSTRPPSSPAAAPKGAVATHAEYPDARHQRPADRLPPSIATKSARISRYMPRSGIRPHPQSADAKGTNRSRGALQPLLPPPTRRFP